MELIVNSGPGVILAVVEITVGHFLTKFDVSKYFGFDRTKCPGRKLFRSTSNPC